MKALIVLCAVWTLAVGCASTGGASFSYETPGVCHFDYGKRHAVRVIDGEQEIVSTDCETAEQVLEARR